MSTSLFAAERFGRLRAERGATWGDPLVAVGETGSTNDLAMSAGRALAPEGATFVADAQSKGRGRRGNTWSSPAGENLLVSVVLRPKLAIDKVSALTLAVGLAGRDAIQPRVEAQVLVKWPNDLLAGGRKLVGILVETQLSGGSVDLVVVGVGINVAMRKLPDEIRESATSLALLGATDLDRESLLVDFLIHLERRTRAYESTGLETMLAELDDVDALRDQSIQVDEKRGTGAGIDRTGALLVRTSSGVERIISGTVTRPE